MTIHKLIYQSKDEAVQDLLDRGVIELDEEQNEIYSSNTKAVVHLGDLISVPGEYDDQGNMIKAPVWMGGYHVDVMLKSAIDFGEHEIKVNNPKHSFYL